MIEMPGGSAFTEARQQKKCSAIDATEVDVLRHQIAPSGFDAPR